MADSLKIGDKTYKKLVTFNDCASTGGNLFPWALVKYDKTKDSSDNAAVLSFNPKYFSENNSLKYISFDELENTPLDAIGSYITGYTVGSKIYEKLVCKNDLNYTTNKYPSIKGKCNYKAPVLTAQVLRINIGVPSSNKEIIGWKAPQKGEVKYIDNTLPLPTQNNDDFHFYIRISDVFTRFVWLSVEPENTKADSFFNISGGGIKQSTSSFSDYVNCYNGGPVKYNLFWNICKLAELNNTKIYFTIDIDN
jgi:hypothetical protein